MAQLTTSSTIALGLAFCMQLDTKSESERESKVQLFRREFVCAIFLAEKKVEARRKEASLNRDQVEGQLREAADSSSR